MENLKINLDKIESVAKALKNTQGYCPCKFPRKQENLCICEDVKNGADCICGLFQASPNQGGKE